MPAVGPGPDDEVAVDRAPRPRSRVVEPADDVEQRRLAAARRADDAHELAVVDVRSIAVEGDAPSALARGTSLANACDDELAACATERRVIVSPPTTAPCGCAASAGARSLTQADQRRTR